MIRRYTVLLTLLVCGLFPRFAHAQATYPDRTDRYVNDFANLIEPGDEERLCVLLTHLREEDRVEATIVTIDSFREHTREDITFEDFATNLFNQWGIGSPIRLNGAMILVAVEDRAVRLELGSGYGFDLDDEAQRIIDEEILPGFREDRYSTGIVRGSEALVALLGSEPDVDAACGDSAVMLPQRQPQPGLSTANSTVEATPAPTASLSDFMAESRARAEREREARAVEQQREQRGDIAQAVLLILGLIGLSIVGHAMGWASDSDDDDDSWSSSRSSSRSSSSRSSSSRSSSRSSGSSRSSSERSSGGGASGRW